MDEHVETILSFLEEYTKGRMFKSTMEKNIDAVIDEIKAEALQEAYDQGFAVPNDMDALLEAIGDNH